MTPEERVERNEKLNELRKNRNSSWTSWAVFSEAIDVPFETLKAFLYKDQKTPNIEVATKVADALGVSLDFVFGHSTHINVENEQIMEITGLSEKSIETLRGLKTLAYDRPVPVIMKKMQHAVLNPDGTIKEVSDPKLTKVPRIFVDNPYVEAKASLDTINALLEEASVEWENGTTCGVIHTISDYMNADKAVPNGKERFIQFKIGNGTTKNIDLKDLYRDHTKEHVIAGLNHLAAIVEKDKEA